MPVKLTKDFLERVYIKEKLSTWEIEKRFGVSRSRVYTSLKRCGIPTRNIAQAQMRYARSDFSGDLCEKAYLIGFTIGDLRVREQNGVQSETISIGCGSTKLAQIKLIHNLFSKYGRVWKSAPNYRGVVNTEAFVNKSFSFLLPNILDYLWCAKNKKHFFSFLAGFTDAEGSFFVSKGGARVAWGNYNTEILNFIRNVLIKFDIEIPKMSCDSLKGYIGSHGYVRNENYCHLTVAKKNSVRQLLFELKPYVLHSDKRRALIRIQKLLA